MKQIILNKDNLKKEEIKEYKRKVRALIIDDNNMVTLCNYHDIYMLPGGKIDDSETDITALIRELKEELGIDFSSKDCKLLLKTITMARDYPIRNSNNTINRVCETDYYVIRSNKKIDKTKINLTESEIRHQFKVQYVPFNRIFEIIENHVNDNKRNQYFIQELLVVLKNYIQFNTPSIYHHNNDDGLIDLHIHTMASDGEMSANEIVEFAINNGAKAISFTDHDTILGYDNLIYDKRKIQIIPGIEMSADIDVGRMHILGYGIDVHNQEFRNKLEELHQNSITNVIMLTEILQKDYGIHFKEEDIQYLTHLSRHIGRPDLAKLMIKYGIVQSVQEAFDFYLKEANNKVNLKKPTFQECFEIIKSAGGIPILAHPHSLLLDDHSLFNKIEEMKKYGLKGIEAYHSNVPKSLSEQLVSYSIDKNLYLTGGSDYHGPIVKPDIELFKGKNNNIKVKKLSLVNDLKDRYL